MTNQDAVQTLAIELARTVGKKIGSALRAELQFAVHHKGAVDLVTEIDLWSDELIQKSVAEHFPTHTVIGEESSAVVHSGTSLAELSTRGTVWVVDPLDGPTNFANLIPHVAVSIAVLHEGERILGVVYDPSRDELFTAQRGKGAFVNGARIHTSEKKELLSSVIATGVPYDRSERWDEYRAAFEAILLRCRDLRRFGAASLDQCWVACGRFDAFFEYGLHPWDIAAGSLIVEEAGGIVTNFRHHAAKLNLFERSYLAASPGIYAETLELLTEAVHGA